MFSHYGHHCCCLLNFVFINCISPFCLPPCHSSGLATGLCSGTIHQEIWRLILMEYHSHVYLYCCIFALPLAYLQYALFTSIPSLFFWSWCDTTVCNDRYCVKSMMMFITRICYLLRSSCAQYVCHFSSTSYLFLPWSEIAVIYDV